MAIGQGWAAMLVQLCEGGSSFLKGRPVCEVFLYDMEPVDGSIRTEQVYGLVRRMYRVTKI
jgi:hypothetical protein